MGHNLDINAGQASFVSAREDAWHQLGVTLPDTFTAEEAMQHGLLGNWNVRKAPIFAVAEDGKKLAMPGRYATIRDNPVVPGQVDVLGNVGETYRAIQNEAHADLLNALVDESGAHFETAGALDGGRRVFITMKLPGFMRVGGVDQVDTYIAALNSHDGSTAFTFLVTPVRIVCQNTLNWALSVATSSFRVRHTTGAHTAMVQQAREALELTFTYLDGFQEQAEQLVNTTMTQIQFEELIQREFGAPEDAAAATITRTENKLAEMAELFADASTQEGIRNTAWAGLNALTEWSDHFSPARGDDPDGTRAQRAVLDASFKTRAANLVSTWAGLQTV